MKLLKEDMLDLFINAASDDRYSYNTQTVYQLLINLTLNIEVLSKNKIFVLLTYIY